jgi:hypothetical protein
MLLVFNACNLMFSLFLQSLEEINVPIEERHIIKRAIDRLKTLTSSLYQ